MPDHLPEVITLVKSGKKQEAQQLLLKILATEPNHEQAWLWLSAVVDEDKRRFCIDKVLSINPANQQAQQALVKLKQLESQAAATPLPPPVPAPPAKPPSLKRPATQPLLVAPAPPRVSTPQAPPAVAPAVLPPVYPPDVDKLLPEFWINKERGVLFITALVENQLVSATVNPGQAKQVQAQLQRGSLSLDLLTNKKVVPFNQISQVSQTMSSVRVHYGEAGSARSIRLECADEAMAQAMLNALEKRLGSGFERSSTPVSIASIAILAFISVAIILGGTIFCYFGAIEAASGELRPTGSARTRTIIALLELLGPQGVTCVGGVLFVLALGVITYYLIKPPLATKLLPKEIIPKSISK